MSLLAEVSGLFRFFNVYIHLITRYRPSLLEILLILIT